MACKFLLNDFLELPFDQGLVPLMRLVFLILEEEDQDLYMLTSDDGNVPAALFSTSWILTLFTHDLE